MTPPQPTLLSCVCALLLIGGGVAQGGAREGLRTGSAHQVVATVTPYQGLEEGIPRDSWYAKGVALDMKGSWRESLAAFGKARDQFQEQLRQHPQWSKLIRGWLLKAEYQITQSRVLRYQTSRRYGSMSFSSSAGFYHTAAKHNKWLAIRAYTGEDVPALRKELLDEYRRLVLQTSYDESPRVGFAALLHELGRHDEARREFARVRAPERGRLAQIIAYYYTVAGDLDRAFAYLDKAVRYSSSSRRRILQSNDFDRLRSDPRFTRLVGEP